jgi:hypothetical protein
MEHEEDAEQDVCRDLFDGVSRDGTYEKDSSYSDVM